jgi:hypothetical protein
MGEHPIDFETDMVMAILDGRKTQARRVVKPQPPATAEELTLCWPGKGMPREWQGAFGLLYAVSRDTPFGRVADHNFVRCRFGEPGGTLYVRETWQHCPECGRVNFLAGANEAGRICQHCDGFLGQWRPSFDHLPRDYARIFLTLTDVKVERVQDISLYDAVREGCPLFEIVENDQIVRCMRKVASAVQDARDWFIPLWDRINGPNGFGWEQNPWVWALSFRVL